MNIKEISKEIYENNKAKGFWEDRLNIPHKMRKSPAFTEEEAIFVEKAIKSQMLMLIVSELSEAMEADREEDIPITDFTKKTIEKLDAQEFKAAFETRVKNTFNDELADAVIRIFDVSFGSDIDLEWHIAQKVRYNKMRPHKHGKAF